MAELSTLARPYAKAAFEYALAAGDLAGWAKQLASLAAIVANSKIESVMSSPSLSGDDQAQILIGICGEELTDQGRNFIKLLAENKRLPLLVEIEVLFRQLKAQQEQSVDVEVASAFELSAAVSDRLADALAKNLQRQVKVSTAVDKTLIGGVIVRAGDIVIDGSVRGRLAKLAASVNS